MKTITFDNEGDRRTFLDSEARPVIIPYLLSSIFWLLLGSALAIMASVKLHLPDWLGATDWLTFGRVRPAHLNTMVYGWASQLGSVFGLWVLSRTLRAAIPGTKLINFGLVIWNIGLVYGTIAILAGFTNGLEWLEFPMGAMMLVVAGLIPSIVSAFGMIFKRQTKHLYISVYYIMAAFIWLPALLIVAYIPDYTPVVESGMNWWYAHNALGLWFTPLSLASAYYFIPKVTGRPIYSYWLSLLGFWSLALFYNWNGFHHLIGGPVPTWAVTISISASVMMIIPVVTVAVNHHLTVVGVFNRVINSPTLRFIVFGAMSYTFVSLQGSMQALRSLNEVVHFTHYVIAHAHIGMYAFVTMILFGGTYFILPRVLNWEWSSKGLIKWHFWLTAIGIILYIVALQIGGIWQGIQMNNPDIPFLNIVATTIPFLQSRSFAAILMTAGHFIFAWLVIKMILDKRKQEKPEPVVSLGKNKGGQS